MILETLTFRTYNLMRCMKTENSAHDNSDPFFWSQRKHKLCDEKTTKTESCLYNF